MSTPDLYDPWGPLARAQIIVMPEGAVTDDGAGHVTFGSTLLVMAGGGNNNWIRVAAGSFTLANYDALCVDLPPTNAPRGTYNAYIDAYPLSGAVDEPFPDRDRLVLGVRNGAGRMSWAHPMLAQATAPRVVTGIVSSGGAVMDGSGYTVSRFGVGRYTVTFVPSFAARPSCVVTLDGNTGNEDCTVNMSGGATFQINIQDAGVPVDRQFNFIAHQML